MAKRTRVAVIFGGRSGEHEVSCKSALSIVEHLDREPLRGGAGPHHAGRHLGLRQVGRVARAKCSPRLPEGALASIADAVGAFGEVDVVFPALHGPYGEDGTIQSVLEMTGLPYVGSGVFASAAGMDKEFTKKLLVAEGLPVADGVVLRGAETVSPVDRERLGLPVFVKPSRAGSSLGVSKVDTWGELPRRWPRRARATARCSSRRPCTAGRSTSACSSTPTAGSRSGPPLEIRMPAQHDVLRLRGQVQRPGHDLRHPGPARAGDHRAAAGLRRPDVPRPGLPRSAARRLLSAVRDGSRSSTRSTRSPGSPPSRSTRRCSGSPALTTRRCSTC